jgi:hypothetical protein
VKERDQALAELRADSEVGIALALCMHAVAATISCCVRRDGCNPAEERDRVLESPDPMTVLNQHRCQGHVCGLSVHVSLETQPPASHQSTPWNSLKNTH